MVAADFLSCYLNGPLPYIRRHITVNKNVLSTLLIKTFPSFQLIIFLSSSVFVKVIFLITLLWHFFLLMKFLIYTVAYVFCCKKNSALFDYENVCITRTRCGIALQELDRV